MAPWRLCQVAGPALRRDALDVVWREYAINKPDGSIVEAAVGCHQGFGRDSRFHVCGGCDKNSADF